MSRPLVRGLFVTDLDGTLLGSDRELPERNRLAIAAATAAGVVVAVVTGRRRSTVCREYAKLDSLAYRVATSNGAVVLAPDNHLPEQVYPLAWSVVDEVVSWGETRERRLLCITAPGDGPGSEAELPDIFVHEPASDRWSTSPTPYEPATLRPVEPSAVRTRPLVHAALPFRERDDADRLATLARVRLGSAVSIHVVRSPLGEGALLELVPRGGKGLALRYLARQLGVGAGQTAAIGDELNDCDLLDAAAHRFTVGGSVLAERRPDSAAVASADRGAVAEALERFLAVLA